LRGGTSVVLGDLDGEGDLDAFVSTDCGETNMVWFNRTLRKIYLPVTLREQGP
jgi:hypothetical protein